MGAIGDLMPVVDAAPANIQDGSAKLRLITAEPGDFPVPAWIRTGGSRVQYIPSLPAQFAVLEGTYEVLSSDPNSSALTINPTDLGSFGVGATPAVTITTSGGVGTKRRIMNEGDYYPLAVTIDPYTGELRGEVV